MKISVIVPALNEAENIIKCVASVEQQNGDFEIIVVDGGSTDGTVELINSRAIVIQSSRGRAVQMNAGARKSSGDCLLFLHADSMLHPRALDRLRQVMTDGRTVGGTFTLGFDSDKFFLRFLSAFTRLKFRYFHFGDQGIFVRRTVFDQLRGYKEMPLMEDLDFLSRLRKTGLVALINLPVTTSSRRFLKRGPVRQQLLNVLLVCCYLLGVKPATLSKWYRANSEAATVSRSSRSEPPGD